MLQRIVRVSCPDRTGLVSIITTAFADRGLNIHQLDQFTNDGSFFVQGLAANNRNLQEVRFPPRTATSVTLTVLEVTAPGDETDDADAVSIAAVEFLSPA